MVAQAFNPRVYRQRQADLCGFEASLVYIAILFLKTKMKVVRGLWR